MQNNGLKQTKPNQNLLPRCLQAVSLQIAGSEQHFMHISSPQRSCHSWNPLCPTEKKMEKTKLLDLSCSHLSARQCKDIAEYYHGVATTIMWKLHLPQGISGSFLAALPWLFLFLTGFLGDSFALA